MPTTTLEPRGAFDLREAIAFLDDFPPAGQPQGGAATLRLALRDDDDVAVGVAVTQAEPDGPVVVDGPATLAARALQLDVDGRPLRDVAERDPVVGGLVAEHPGRRPVLFPSPLQAAVWAVLSQRQPRAQASRVRDALAGRFGEDVDCAGAVRRAAPSAAAYADLPDDAVPGLWPQKAERLRGLGRAAADGRLDLGALRAVEPDEAIARVRELPGLGPFGATLVVVRGAGHPDVVPLGERRLRAAVRDRYGLEAEPDDTGLRELAEAWRPLRTWVAFLLRSLAGH